MITGQKDLKSRSDQREGGGAGTVACEMPSLKGHQHPVSARRKLAAIYMTSREDKAGLDQAPSGSSLLGSLPPPHDLGATLPSFSAPFSQLAFVDQRQAS